MKDGNTLSNDMGNLELFFFWMMAYTQRFLLPPAINCQNILVNVVKKLSHKNE